MAPELKLTHHKPLQGSEAFFSEVHILLESTVHFCGYTQLWGWSKKGQCSDCVGLLKPLLGKSLLSLPSLFSENSPLFMPFMDINVATFKASWAPPLHSLLIFFCYPQSFSANFFCYPFTTSQLMLFSSFLNTGQEPPVFNRSSHYSPYIYIILWKLKSVRKREKIWARHLCPTCY